MLASQKVNEVSTAIQVLNVNTKERLKAMNMVDLGRGKFYQKQKIVKEDF